MQDGGRWRGNGEPRSVSNWLTKACIHRFGSSVFSVIRRCGSVTKQERVELPKLGSGSLAFDEQCASYMATAPNLVPPFVDPDEVTKDRALRLVLADAFREVKKLCEKLDDTLMLVGSEIWMADLSFYQTVRQAARRDVPGADTIYDDLKARFPGVAGDAEDEEGEEPTPPTP